MELPAGPDGKRRQIGKGGYVTAKDAADARAEVIRLHRTGRLPVDGKRLLRDWLDEWLPAKIARGELGDSSARSYTDFIEMYLKPQLGHVKLAELRPDQITAAYATVMRDRQAARAAAIAKNERYAAEAAAADQRRIARGLVRPIKPKRCAVPPTLGPTTIRRIHATLSGALTSAEKAGLITRNVAELAELPKATKTRVEPWAPDEFGAFLESLDQAGQRLLPLFLFAGFSGLRRGELAGLRWDDLDLDSGRVSVRRQRVPCRRKGHHRDHPRTQCIGGVCERDTKTESSEGVTYVDDTVLSVLRTWRKTQLTERLAWGPAYHDGGYVFVQENGQPYHPEHLTKLFSRLCRQAGVPQVRLHDLRHLSASLDIAAGTDIAVVSKRLRHSSIKITADTYVHLKEQTSREAAQKAAALVHWRRPA